MCLLKVPGSGAARTGGHEPQAEDGASMGAGVAPSDPAQVILLARQREEVLLLSGWPHSY